LISQVYDLLARHSTTFIWLQASIFSGHSSADAETGPKSKFNPATNTSEVEDVLLGLGYEWD